MQMAIDVAGFTPAEADQLRQAMGSKRSAASGWSGCARRLYDGHGRAGHHRRDGRRDLREAGRLRQLRLPREPLGELRLPRLRHRRGSSATTRPRSAPRCSTPSRWASTRRTRWCRTPAATAWRSAPRTSTRPTGTATLERRRRRSGPTGPSLGTTTPADRGAWAGPAVRLGIGSVRGIGDDLAEAIAAGRPYADDGGPGAAAPGLTLAQPRGAGHRRGVRLLRRSTPARGAVAGRGGGPGRGPTGCPASSPAWTRPPLPGMTDARRRSPTCGPPACRPTATPPGSSATSSTGAGVRHRRGLRDVRRRRRKVLVGGVVTHRQRPATAGGHHVPQPRGRDRPDQRGRARRAAGPATAGWPGLAPGPAGPGPARAGRGRDQRGRRAASSRCPSAPPPGPATSAEPSAR